MPIRLKSLALQSIALIAGALVPFASTLAQSGEYPSKPIRMIIPFAAGGTTDLLARGISAHLSKAWNQPVVNENRPGANGLIAAEQVAKAAGDPYILHTVAMGHAINPLLYRKMPFDAERDFTPISLIATFPQLVLIHPSVPATTLKELIALARRGTPALNYASGGNGSSQHLAGALFMSMAGLQMPHVPYKGGNPALIDLIGGQVSLMIVQPNSRDQITSGKLRALAVSSAKRSRHYPDIPTVDEAGLPGYQSVAWYGIVAPRDLPTEALAKLSAEVARAIQSPGVRNVIDSQGGDLVASSPAEFATFMRAERDRYRDIIQSAGIVID